MILVPNSGGVPEKEVPLQESASPTDTELRETWSAAARAAAAAARKGRSRGASLSTQKRMAMRAFMKAKRSHPDAKKTLNPAFDRKRARIGVARTGLLARATSRRMGSQGRPMPYALSKEAKKVMKQLFKMKKRRSGHRIMLGF